ncbi:MAG: 4-hydroxy-tetrahydrodipicolinate synthase [Verrucomicrobia bacterium A1]|nr:MAG: 4-hydroxy-tetrahydrodipicolinate synthase [Verrucomicrobia bacterium A1]
MSSLRATRELKGTFTAIVTPFDKSGAVDFGKLRELVEWQIAAGVTGIVPVGTTGESPTLDVPEHEKVIATVIEVARGRCLVIAGTGANSTAEAVELTRAAKAAGADATLQVTPYYNKPTATGLLRHFSAVADLGLPVVLYNVPGRTSREIPIDVIVKLADHPGVISVKEAGGSVERVSRIVRSCNLSVLSGDDSLTLPMIAVGVRGVISVASNVAPEPVVALVNHALAGRFAEARALHLKYYALFTDLFLETNPVPVKAALAMMGRIEEVYRLPLCEMEPKTRAALAATLCEAGLLKA